MKLKVYNQAGTAVGDVSLEPKLFGVAVKPTLVEQAIRTHLANRRQPIAHTKTRSEVRGGGRKPWRQKGTGRARQGSIRAPQWKGGGVIFGPRSIQNWSLKMNRKARRAALTMVLSDKAQDGKVVILDSLKLAAGKTKELVGILQKLPLKKTILAVLPQSDQAIVRAARNVPSVTVINADSLNVYDAMRHEYLLILRGSLDVMRRTYLGAEPKKK
ncbi:MAG: 50S ribosomal protein L4 [Patescibacteria group bacterium]